jgi:hypothetical protein
MSHVRFLGGRALFFAALCLLTPGLVFGQSDTASLSGFVKDPSQAIVANANVVIRNEATGLTRTVKTNDQGSYTVASLPPGYYTVTVEATGFKKFVSTNNKLDPSVSAQVNATLDVGAVTETVEIVAAAATLQSETATVGKLVEGRQIKDLMLNGRNPLFLALLKPGVRGGALSGFSFGLSSGGMSINGGRTQDLLIAFDGAVGIRTRANGTSIGTADLETVQEVQILTANYNAEYGRSSGGQIRMVTKSGTRDFHGSLYEYFRNDKLDANQWSRNRVNLPREAQRFNQYGFILSGPVYIPNKWNTDRNKLFFLWGEEWIKRRRDVTNTAQTVPSLAMRQGNFAELLDPTNRFFGRARPINDPTTGAPFAGNIIPATRVSPNGRGFMNAYPEPNGVYPGSANFLQTRPQPEDQRKDTFSFDVVPSEKHTIRLRHQRYEWVSVDAFRSNFDRAVTDWSRPNRTASLNHIWSISPTMINEFLATASVDRVYIGIYRPGERFARSQYGINYPYIFPERKEIFDKIPTLDLANFGTLDGGPYPSQSTGPVYVLSNNVTRIMGNHTLKFGGYFERLGQNDFDQINVSGVPGGTNNQNGRFVFTDGRTSGTGVAIGNAALGLFDTYAEIGPRAYTPYRSQGFEWFLQDAWRVSQKLRLELGVRYTYMTPYYKSLWGNIAVFDPARYNAANAAVVDRATGNVISGDRYNGVFIPGSEFPDAAKGRVAIADSGEFNRLFNNGSVYWGQTQKNNFQPRFGLAYSINAKTVVRAGGGRFMARPGVSDNIFLGGNPPFQPMVSINNGQADNPGGGARTGFPQFFMTSDPVFKIPSAWNWSATIQREIGWNTTVEVGYVGRTGLHLERERELNALRPGTVQANPNVNVNALRPYAGFANIPMGENAARSEYNGLQFDVNRRFTRGLSYGFAYTLSKSEDNGSDRRARLYNPFDDRNFWGKSNFDTRHVAVINFIYELPFLKDQQGFHGKVLGGWQVTGVVQFQTGTPGTVGRSVDYAGIGIAEFQPWNVNGDAFLPRGERAFSESAADSNFWFRTTNGGQAIFTQPASGTFANQNRQSLPVHGPGFQNWNIAGFKDFRITERHNVNFRAEFFNFINHPNWGGATGGGIGTDPSNATTFGKVTAKGGNREVQLSLRYSF